MYEYMYIFSTMVGVYLVSFAGYTEREIKREEGEPVPRVKS